MIKSFSGVDFYKMKNQLNKEIYDLCLSERINFYNIKEIQVEALKKKRYDLVIHLNVNITDYLIFLSRINKNFPSKK